MATERSKDWFFQSERTKTGTRFSRYNRPSEETFRDFIASVPFFLDNGSSASTSRLGLTKRALDADVLNRVIYDDSNRHVEPYHVPIVKSYLASAAPSPTKTVPTASAGIKTYLEEITTSQTGIDYLRYDYMIAFDPDNLTAGSFDSSADYAIFIDATDKLPYKVLASTFLAGGLFGRASTTITPVNAGDTFDMGTGDVKGAEFYLTKIKMTTGAREIYIDGTAGSALSIYAETKAAGIGGAIKLYGGAGSTYGGDAYLYGGSGVTDYGDSFLCWDGTTKRGLAAIGGAKEAGYQLKVYGKAYVASGGMRLVGSGVSAITQFVGLDANNDFQVRTATQFLSDALGTPTVGDIMYFNGTIWTRLAKPASAKYLYNDSGGTLAWADAVATSDGKLKVDSAATSDYLGATRSSGVVQVPTNGGLVKTDGGNYVGIALDVDDLDEITELPRSAFVPITNDAGDTKKFNLATLFASSREGWMALAPTTDYDVTPDTLSQIGTADLRSSLEPGMPILFKLDSVAAYRCAVITAVGASSISIAGDPLGSGTVADIEELYVGPKSKVTTKTYSISNATYNASTSVGLLEAISNMKQGDRWTNGSAKCVRIETVNMANDSTANPLVNARVGIAASTTDCICTANTSGGVETTTTWASSGVEIDPAKNSIAYGENIELKVDKNSGTGDAQYLTVVLTFVLL